VVLLLLELEELTFVVRAYYVALEVLATEELMLGKVSFEADTFGKRLSPSFTLGLD